MSNAGVRAFPAGSCDTHIHIYDSRYPAAPSALIRPADALVADYRLFLDHLGHGRGLGDIGHARGEVTPAGKLVDGGPQDPPPFLLAMVG